ncbi:MAG: phosphoethanolamine transferase [Betaproteobacteria bacterium]
MRIQLRHVVHLALWGYLLSPLMLQPFLLKNGRDWFEILFLFNVFTSALWVSLFSSLRIRPLVLHLLAFPLYLLTAADLFMLFNYGNRLSSAYFGILLTDYSEAGEFAATFLQPILNSLMVMAAVYLSGLFALRRLPLPPRNRVAGISALVLLLTYSAQFASTYRNEDSFRFAALDVLGKELGSPMGGIFQGGLALILKHESRMFVEKRKSHSFAHVSASGVSPDSIFVWVIGESSRPHNWGLMGYARDTTPRLQAIAGVVPLPDLLANAPHTEASVLSMLSLNSIKDWNTLLSERTIISVFNQAGFKTYWLSVQEADGWGGMIQHVAAEAKQRKYFDRARDSVLVDEFRTIIENKSPAEPLFVVLHTKGSHWHYSRRYPPSFEKFKEGKNTREQLVDAYDNSILYTDWVISEIIRTVAQKKIDAAVLYVSDHGQNLLDDAAQLRGHAFGNTYDLHTAGLIWLSPALQKKRRAEVANLEKHRRLPISMADLPHSYLDIAGIRVDGFNATRSLFSAKYTVKERWYRFQGGPNKER